MGLKTRQRILSHAIGTLPISPNKKMIARPKNILRQSMQKTGLTYLTKPLLQEHFTSKVNYS
jgi:hypothetical protein